jgi:general secretion pathway protein C
MNLVVLAVAALLVAQLLSTVVEGELASVARPPRAPAPRLPQDPLPIVSGSRLATVLGVQDARRGEPAVVEPAVGIAVPIVLLGTLAPGFAALVDGVDQRVRTVAVGDVVHEVEIASIEHRFITVRFRGQLARVDLRGAPMGPAPSPAVVRSTPQVITRDEVRGAIDRLPQLATQVQVVPAFLNGAFAGFRITRLEADSLLARAGLVAGDVVQRVNGLDLSRAENLGALLAQAPNVRRVEVELTRNAQPVRLSLSLE